MESVKIQQLQEAELRQAAMVLGRAFSTQPNNLAIFGEKNIEQQSRSLFWLMLKRFPGIVYGARKDDQIVGVMRMVEWPRCQMKPLQVLRHLPSLLIISRGGALRGLRLRQVWARHDPKKPHWHIDPLGVDPELQGKGVGSQLMTFFCERVDAEHKAAYLETDRPANVPFYQRFGYAVTGEAEINGVRNWLMWRPSH